MEYKLPNNVVLSTTQRAHEFVPAVTWLLETFPVPLNGATFKFQKKDGVNTNANADYDAYKWEGFFNPIIRVSYGDKGNNPKALHYLFHEYKHLLQDSEGYLHDPETQHINHCIEADAWAHIQLPLYLAHSHQTNIP